MIKTETQCIYRLFFVLLFTAKLKVFRQQICFVSIETSLDRNNLRSKIQGCIDIVRKRYKVCYIDFLLNMSLSKIKKSVVTVRHIRHIRNLRIRNEFTDLLFNVWEDSSFRWLSEIREPVWSYIINLRSAFTLLGIVMPVLARHLRKEHLVILMKRKRAFSWH